MAGIFSCLLSKYKLKRNKYCRFFRGSFFDKKTVFEGHNLLSLHSKLFDCFLGYGSYVGEGTRLIATKIGRYTCIGPNVNIAVGEHPTKKIVSIHPAFYGTHHPCGFSYTDRQLFDESKYCTGNYHVVIGNDVWIATDALLVEGVSIGDGAVVVAGAVVTKDIPPYAIVGGVPSKIIRYRFEQDDIDFLLKLKWWNKDEDWIKAHAEYFEDIKLLRKKVEEESSSE